MFGMIISSPVLSKIISALWATFGKYVRRYVLPGIEPGALSAAKSESLYWRIIGLARGKKIYNKYLKLFELDPKTFADKSVADFGCGPFGGVLSVIPMCLAGYPIDVLADKYNSWGKSRYKIYEFDGEKTQIPDGASDVVFCTNAIDHTTRPDLIVKEIHRILRSRGKLYLHVHLKKQEQLDKIHPIAWDVNTFKRLFSAFEVNYYKVIYSDWINGGEVAMLYAQLTKSNS